jgi:V8-like Glu-specific endopeptidase
VPNEGSQRITCSGTLLAPQVFLTAAHCGDALAHYNATTADAGW